MAATARGFADDVPAVHDIAAIGDRAADDIGPCVGAPQDDARAKVKRGPCRSIDDRIEGGGRATFHDCSRVHLDTPDPAHGDVVGDEVPALLHVCSGARVDLHSTPQWWIMLEVTLAFSPT